MEQCNTIIIMYVFIYSFNHSSHAENDQQGTALPHRPTLTAYPCFTMSLGDKRYKRIGGWNDG